MRPLDVKTAARCEDADGSRCRCRCGGALHGARRGWVGALPDDDPHKPARAWMQLALDFGVPARRVDEPAL